MDTIGVAFIGWAGACAHLRPILWYRKSRILFQVLRCLLLRKMSLPFHPRGLGVREGSWPRVTQRLTPIMRTLASQVTWLHCCLTSPAGSSSTPSSTWVPSVCSRCSSRTPLSCKASCSSASSQVREQRKQRTPRQALAGTNRLRAASGSQWP